MQQSIGPAEAELYEDLKARGGIQNLLNHSFHRGLYVDHIDPPEAVQHLRK